MKYVTGVILVFIFTISVIFSSYFTDLKNSILGFSIGGNVAEDEVFQLRQQNESLKARLALLEFSGGGVITEKNVVYRSARVHLTYPFNNHNTFTINLGSNDGMEKLMPVAVVPGVLLGQIIEVYPNYSLVRSLFDPEFKIAVRIGSSQANSLMEGGNEPTLAMINKKDDVKVGDLAFSADINFPYGIKVGAVSKVVGADEKNVFKMANLEVGYNPNDLKEVFVIINYKTSK